MPTSSQALILRQGTSSSDAQLNRGCCFEPQRCLFTPLYSLNGRIKHDIATVDLRFGNSVINVPHHDNTKYSFVTRIDINGHTDHVVWDAMPVDNCPSESSIGSAGTKFMKENGKGEHEFEKSGVGASGSFTAKPLQATLITKRPKTAIPIQTTSISVPNVPTPTAFEQSLRPTFSTTLKRPEISHFMTEPLVNLGFRKESLSVRKDCVYDPIAPRKLLLHPRKGDKEVLNVEGLPKFTYTKVSAADLASKSAELVLTDSESESLDVDGFKRVKPSMHMRGDVPEKRPTAAIFSFRDNEFSSHAEVKYLIETQIGVKVKTIKFDPLDIRCCKPDVRSRWIVDFHTVPDVEKVIKKGLILGKDKLVFYRHDDITKRELCTWKFFMKVQEAKKRLKGSAKSRRNTSRNKHSISAKCTKSAH